MEMPEFDIFKRIENLEAKFGNEAFNIKDAIIISVISMRTSFLTMCVNYPQNSRLLKDQLIAALKQSGLSKIWIENIQEDLLNICNLVDRK